MRDNCFKRHTIKKIHNGAELFADEAILIATELLDAKAPAPREFYNCPFALHHCH